MQAPPIDPSSSALEGERSGRSLKRILHRIALKGVIFRAALLMERGGTPGMAAMTGAMRFLPRRRCEGLLELVAMAGCGGGGAHPTRSIFSSAIAIAIATVCIARRHGWTVCLSCLFSSVFLFFLVFSGFLSVRLLLRLFVCSLVSE